MPWKERLFYKGTFRAILTFKIFSGVLGAHVGLYGTGIWQGHYFPGIP